jgi:hypothetical protein
MLIDDPGCRATAYLMVAIAELIRVGNEFHSEINQ